MQPPCDLIKALTIGSRSWRVTGDWRPLWRQNCPFLWSGRKCTFDIEKSSHIRHFLQSNRRESSSLTSSGSYWDSSTWTYLEFAPKTSEDNCEITNAERRALNTHTGHFTVIISKRFHFFVVLELQWSLRLIYYIFNPLNTEFRSQKKRIFFPTSPLWICFPPLQ